MFEYYFRHIVTYRRPSLGAYFASRPLLLTSMDGIEDTWNVYATPAAISFVLLLAETIYLTASLSETKGWRAVGEGSRDVKGEDGAVTSRDSSEKRLARLSAISRLHGLFLLFFSGVMRILFIAGYSVLTEARPNLP